LHHRHKGSGAKESLVHQALSLLYGINVNGLDDHLIPIAQQSNKASSPADVIGEDDVEILRLAGIDRRTVYDDLLSIRCLLNQFHVEWVCIRHEHVSTYKDPMASNTEEAEFR
jgi:hypothetical protein